MHFLHLVSAIVGGSEILSNWLSINGQVGNSGAHKVFLGFSKGKHLKIISFADVLDETLGTGYQRRFNKKHSLDFRKYIQTTSATTIPLTFNLRPNKAWSMAKGKNGQAVLKVDLNQVQIMAQVDCQHRMGFMTDSDVDLPFMAFIGLSLKEEMEVFSIINSKAKGLNASLLDYHASVLTSNLAVDRPELLIALFLHGETTSPWYNHLDLGGTSTSGMTRKASLRTMQKAIKKFLTQSKILNHVLPEDVCVIVENYWLAVSSVLAEAWDDPRKHVLTKGIGVYALMGLAADFAKEVGANTQLLTEDYFSAHFSDFAHQINWASDGSFKGLGGEKGAKEALTIIRNARQLHKLKIVQG